MQSWGIPADKIAECAGVPIPGNLYYEIATRQERVAKAPEQILYDTHHIAETVNMYFADG
jgi:alanyl-tRNA synthetase